MKQNTQRTLTLRERIDILLVEGKNKSEEKRIRKIVEEKERISNKMVQCAIEGFSRCFLFFLPEPETINWLENEGFPVRKDHSGDIIIFLVPQEENT